MEQGHGKNKAALVSKWAYFTEKEVEGLDSELVSKLDTARKAAGIPFVISSGRRTIEQETALKGGVRNSSHVKGLAVDLKCGSDQALFLMLRGLMAAGFERIGIYHDEKQIPHHIHADIDASLPPKCVWLKLEQN